jgi:hypothetical protein
MIENDGEVKMEIMAQLGRRDAPMRTDHQLREARARGGGQRAVGLWPRKVG